MQSRTPTIEPFGDFALYLHYPGGGYNAQVSAFVLALAERLRASGIWRDVVAGYDSVLASFDPAGLSERAATEQLRAALKAENAEYGTRGEQAAEKITAQEDEIVDIPVYYGGDSGPDMDNIMARSGLSETEIIHCHCAPIYRVCMMGFVPGFTFLSEAPKALHHPRHHKPRLRVPSGSVGIGGWQTGIYSLPSPGGWQIIGRTSLDIFDAARAEPFLLKAGDSVRFIPQNGPFPQAHGAPNE